MNELDVYYRALIKYREYTQQNKDCVSASRSVAGSNTDADKITLTRKHCIVEEDWVNAIEEGLKYIEKAIAEERQFIRSNGEIVPIEKVKSVSKDSVVHLAKHSNLITREIPGEDIVPDHLYTVEKLNDYAVYENRFLYMLLCYLRDFITMRYNRILELSNTYSGTMTMSKVVKGRKRNLKYNVDLTEERKDDEYLKETNRAKEIINRIDLLLKTVLAFLSRPLMEFVSKAPMLKPPITKTNVLKMNNNFKQAMNLYGFLVSYKGDGYRVETEVKNLSPFADTVAEELSETVLLSSFLTYEHSLGIEDDLKRKYELEEIRLKEIEYQKFLEKLEAARIKVAKSGMSPEEYIIMLEKNMRTLEKKAKELDKLKVELTKTKKLLDDTLAENKELSENLEKTIKELQEEKERYIRDMAALKAEHEREIENLNAEHERIIEEMKREHESALQAMRDDYEGRLSAMRDRYEGELKQMREDHESEIADINRAHEDEMLRAKEERDAMIAELKVSYEDKLSQKDATIDEILKKAEKDKAEFKEELDGVKRRSQDAVNAAEAKRDAAESELAEQEKQNRFLNAELLTLKKETGRLTDEDSHITKLKFDELEKTFLTFKAYYRSEWSKAKKQIRRDVLKKNKNKSEGGADEE